MGRRHHGLDGPLCDHLAIGQRGNAITDSVKAVEIVRYHENREPQSLLQGADEFVEIPRADGIKA